MKLEEALMLYF